MERLTLEVPAVDRRSVLASTALPQAAVGGAVQVAAAAVGVSGRHQPMLFMAAAACLLQAPIRFLRGSLVQGQLQV